MICIFKVLRQQKYIEFSILNTNLQIVYLIQGGSHPHWLVLHHEQNKTNGLFGITFDSLFSLPNALLP